MLERLLVCVLAICVHYLAMLDTHVCESTYLPFEAGCLSYQIP